MRALASIALALVCLASCDNDSTKGAVSMTVDSTPIDRDTGLSDGALTDIGRLATDGTMLQPTVDATTPDAVGDVTAPGPSPDAASDAAPMPVDPQADCQRQPNAAAPELREGEVNGQRMLYSTTPTDVGILLLFHGNGGSPSIWIDRTEHVIATRAALNRGLLVIALKSMEMGWNKACCDGEERCCDQGDCCTDQVDDIRNVNEAIAHVVAEGLAVEGVPIYGLGYSNGGGFTGRLTQGIQMVAAATVNSGSSGRVLATAPDVPPMFFQGASQDPIVSPQRVQTNHTTFVNRALRTELRINEPAPLTPGRLSRIVGISCELSIRLYENLQESGLIGEDGTLVSTPDEIMAYLEESPAWQRQGLEELSRNITLQFRELYAQHAFSSEWIEEVMDFLLVGER